MTHELATPRTAPAERRVQLPPAAELWRTTVTAVLLALLVAWMLAAWWSAPREASVAQLDGAVATGEVTSFVRTNGLEQSGRFWGSAPQPRSDSRGLLIVWQTQSGQTFWVDTVTPDGLSHANREASAIEHRLQSAGIPELYRTGAAPMVAMILVLFGLVVLVNGPPPRRGTRWFWFWSAGAPAGLGVLAYVILERIRPSSRPAPAANQKDRRWHGFAGLGVYLLSTVVWLTMFPWLHGIFGPWFILG